MIYKLQYKRMIMLLAIGVMIILSFLWYKKEAANNIIPKKASYVLNGIDWKNANV